MICAGIIGFGYMGHFHYNATKKFPGHIQSVAVYDIDKNKREEADGFGMRTYDNLRDFLKEDLDLVIIATPNQWHAQYAVEAMKAGRNVLTEKPVTMTVKELEEVISWEKKTGKIFTVHQQRRHDADYQVVRDVVRSGEIGKVTTIESRVFGERGVCFGWRGDPVCGGGMLYDWGVHLIDQMLQLFQGEKVKSVSARLLSILTPAVDDYFELDMEFEKKVCAKIIVTTFALEKMPRWYVLGDKGTLKIEDFSGTAGSGRKIRTGIRGFDSVLGKKIWDPVARWLHYSRNI